MNESSLPHNPFYLIRHGETEWNIKRFITGQQDIPLNDTGLRQAAQAAELLLNKDIQHIYASSLLRTRQTADIINRSLDLPIIYSDALIERGWGTDEGKPHVNSLSMLEDKDLPEGAETYQTFQRRITKALIDILDSTLGTPLIVAHGGVFLTLMHFLKHPTCHIKNCRPYIFIPPQKGEKMWAFNEIDKD